MDWFFLNLTCFDSWLHQTITEPIFAATCRLLKMTRRNLTMSLFGLFSFYLLLAPISIVGFTYRQMEDKTFSLLCAFGTMLMFGFRVFPLFDVDESGRLPVRLEVFLRALKRIRPICCFAMSILFVMAPVFCSPEKIISDILSETGTIFFVLFLHILDVDDLSKP